MKDPLTVNTTPASNSSVNGWHEKGEFEHLVQFYDTDAFLVDFLSEFTGTGLREGDVSIIIATKAHRDSLEERLQANGLDLAAARVSGAYISLDASETLSKIMVDGLVAPGRFAEVVGGLIIHAALTKRRVRVFGEMVTLLCEDGNYADAIRLEELWSELGNSHEFSLCCAYPMHGFARQEHSTLFAEICTRHTRVIPDEHYLRLENSDDRLRSITLLQQKAHSLEAEITERKKAEELYRITDNQSRHLAAIVESSNDAIIGKTLDGIITSWNPAAERMYGYTAQETVGQPVSLICPPDQVDEIPSLLERLKRGERIEHYETVRRRKDGRLIDVSLTISPIRDQAGRIIGASKIARDITERKRVEEQLREDARVIETLHTIGATLIAKLDLQAIVQAVTDAGTSVTHAQFGSFFYNAVNGQGESHMLYTLSGAAPEEFSSLPMPRTTPLFVPTFAGEAVVRLDDVTADPRYGQTPPYFGMPEGHLPVRSYLAVPVVSRSGEVLGGLFFGHSTPGIFTERDERLVVGIAGQAAIAIDNARLYDQAQQAIRAREEFLSMASHELKTPLTTLKVSAQLLARQISQPELDRDRLWAYADRLQVQMSRMEQLVADLLDVSRIQQGRLDLRPEVCDLREIAEDVLTRCEEASERSECHRLVLGAPEPVGVVIDPIRIDQALTNLVTNALKYSPDGGTIQLTVAREDGHAVVAVSDQGIGISSADQNRLFHPFARSDAVRGSVSGSGLGLHITRQIIEQHGGLITVDSEVGIGSTFTIRLPMP